MIFTRHARQLPTRQADLVSDVCRRVYRRPAVRDAHSMKGEKVKKIDHSLDKLREGFAKLFEELERQQQSWQSLERVMRKWRREEDDFRTLRS